MPTLFRGHEVSKLVLDLDLTLYSDSEEMQEAIFGDARDKMTQKILEAEERNLNFLHKLIRKAFRGYSFQERRRQFIQEAKVNGWGDTFTKSGGKMEDFAGFFREGDEKTLSHLQYNPDLARVLKKILNLGLEIYIFTGSGKQRAEDILDLVVGPIWKEFSGILTSEDMQLAHKPSPLAYMEMLYEFGLNPAETIFVDDQVAELDAAYLVGLNTILKSEEPEPGDIEQQTHLWIDSILTLPSFLKTAPDNE